MPHVGLDNAKPLRTFEHVKKQGPYIKTSSALPATYGPQYLTSKHHESNLHPLAYK